MLGRDTDAGDDVVARAREGDERAAAFDHRGVASVQTERERVGQHLGGTERILERSPGPLDVGHVRRVGLARGDVG